MKFLGLRHYYVEDVAILEDVVRDEQVFHQVARCVNGITSVIGEDAETASTRF